MAWTKDLVIQKPTSEIEGLLTGLFYMFFFLKKFLYYLFKGKGQRLIAYSIPIEDKTTTNINHLIR